MRIGVYGGTFDPIHNTHLEIAETARQHAGLDEVLFVVSAAPPHKKGDVHASAEDRFAMVAAAVEDNSAFTASRIEVDREGPSYMADTLEALAREHPDAALYLIVGSDCVQDMPGWYKPETIVQHARLLVVKRPEAPLDPPPLLQGRCETLPFHESRMSSTTIRNRLCNGGEVATLVPPKVLEYIRDKGHYHAPC